MSSVTAELPEDKPKLICGIGQPDEVLECLEAGVDLFESFCPYQVTEQSCALSFGFDYQPNAEDTVLQQNGKKEEKRAVRGHRGKVTTTKRIPETSLEINLKEKNTMMIFVLLLRAVPVIAVRIIVGHRSATSA